MKHAIAAAAGVLALTIASGALASTASQREYKRGYADCAAGRWDENQHGESYKKGCRAAEDKRDAAGGSAATTAAASGSPDAMLNMCKARAARAYGASVDDIEVKYEGQRVNGTHAVNGNHGGDPAATFQCSFNRKGSKIVSFTRAAAPKSVDGVPAGDKKACLLAVKKQTQNPKVVVLGVESSEANNSVTVGVGPQRAPWRCLVKRGIVADVMSMTNEGGL